MAEKKYRLRFVMGDGTEQSVEFAVPYGAQADWNQFDERMPDGIKNRPFGEGLFGVDSIAWDGDTTDKLLTGEDGDAIRYCRIHDIVPAASDFAYGGKIEAKEIATATWMHTVGSLIAAGAALALSAIANIGDEYLSVTGGGSYAFAKYDTLYVGNATYMVAEDAKFSGGNAKVYVMGGVVEKHSSGSSVKYKGGKTLTQYEITMDTITTVEHDFTSVNVTDLNGAVAVKLNDISYCVFVKDAGTYAIENDTVAAAVTFASAGVYSIFSAERYVIGLTVTGFAFDYATQLKQIDPKYIPDEIARTEDVNGALETAMTAANTAKTEATNAKTAATEAGDRARMNGVSLLFSNIPGALHWDGVIGDRKYFMQSDGSVLVHVSDVVPDFSHFDELGFALGMVIVNENFVPIATTTGFEISDDMAVGAEGMIYIIMEDTDADTPKGVYFWAQNFIAEGTDVSIAHIATLAIHGTDFSGGSGDISKYFTSAGSTSVGSTITYHENGAVSNRIRQVFDEAGTSYLEYWFVQVATNTPSVDELNSYAGTASTIMADSDGETQVMQLQSAIMDTTTGAYANLDFTYVNEAGETVQSLLGIIVVYQSFAADGFEIQEPGIYFMQMRGVQGGVDVGGSYTKSFTIPGYNFIMPGGAIIKTECLPPALRFGETGGGGDTLTWDGNTTGLTGTDGMYKVSDSVPTIDDFANGCDIAFVNAGVSETMHFTQEEVAAMEFEKGIFFYVGYVVYVTIEVEESGATLSPGVYFFKEDDEGLCTKSLRIPGYTGFGGIKKIDPKYLPSTMPSVTSADAGKFMRVSASGTWVAEAVTNAEEASF